MAVRDFSMIDREKSLPQETGQRPPKGSEQGVRARGQSRGQSQIAGRRRDPMMSRNTTPVGPTSDTQVAGRRSYVAWRAGRALAFCRRMTTTEETTNAFTEVLDAAGAKPCGLCGKRAAVRTEVAAPVQSAGGTLGACPDRVDNATWFCFECGHEE